MPDISSEKNHFKRWTTTSSAAKDVNERLHAISASDFTSVKRNSGEDIGSSYFHDANRNLFDCSDSYEQSNENKEAWATLDEDTILSIYTHDSTEQFELKRWLKMAPRSVSRNHHKCFNVFEFKASLRCDRGPANFRGGGNVGKVWCLKALREPTLGTLTKIKKGMSTIVEKHLCNSDPEQFPAAVSGQRRGKATRARTPMLVRCQFSHCATSVLPQHSCR
jgi:hypothetical protein